MEIVQRQTKNIWLMWYNRATVLHFLLDQNSFVECNYVCLWTVSSLSVDSCLQKSYRPIVLLMKVEFANHQAAVNPQKFLLSAQAFFVDHL